MTSSFPVNFMVISLNQQSLDVILAAGNSTQRHVAFSCCVCYCHPQEQRRVHRYLTHEAAVKVTNALVSSRLDYWNSLLYHTKGHILGDFK